MAERDRWKYGQMTAEALTTQAFTDLGHRVVDREVIPDLGGSPDGMVVWLIFASREEADAASQDWSRLEQRTREVLEAHGYPSGALPSLWLGYTSVADIEEGGGRFYYFR